jgi:hypothetical protein
MVAVGGRFGLTARVTVLDVAGFPEMQVEFEVARQKILSPAKGI